MIEYRRLGKENANKVLSLFAAEGWISASKPRELEIAVNGAEFSLGAFCGERLVGVICVISDGAMNAFVTYLIVDEDFRGRGIGIALVKAVLDMYKNYPRIMLFCSDKNIGFYQHLGFSHSLTQNVMAIENFEKSL